MIINYSYIMVIITIFSLSVTNQNKSIIHISSSSGIF